MGENIEIRVLKNIKKETSSFFKKKARQEISTALRQMDEEIKKIYELYPFKNNKPTEDHEKKFLELVFEYKGKCATAVINGAMPKGIYIFGTNSTTNPEWVSAEACRSYATILATCSEEDQKYAKTLVDELIKAGL